MPKTLSKQKPAVKVRAKLLVKNISNSVKKNIRTSRTAEAIKAGYSPSYAQSAAIGRTKTWNELMAERLSDDKLTQVHNELLCSAEIQHYIFPRVKTEVEVELEPQPAGGKLKRNKKKQVKYGLTEAEIKAIVEGVGGCKLIYIKEDTYLGQVAFYQAPDNRSRKDALDMAYKLKGNYAPDRIEMSKRKYQDLSSAELMALQTKLKNYLTKK